MKEIRNCEISCETRAESPAGENKRVLVGNPVCYEAPTTINGPAGRFTEIIKRGALDGADLSDVRLLFSHDLNRVPLARVPRTMQLAVTPAGLTMRAELPDTEDARSVYMAVQRGDLSGMSFAFKVPPGGDSYDPVTNTRSIFKIEKILECSVVPFPAYPEASVEARAAIQDAQERARALTACETLLKPDQEQEKTQALVACNRIMMKEV